MTANDTQVGGDHYKCKYEHWDFVLDIGLDYILGCATKYVFRWRKKNGVEDLRKAKHYLEKAEEWGVMSPVQLIEREFYEEYPEAYSTTYAATRCLNLEISRFIAQLPDDGDRDIIKMICDGRYDDAKFHIDELIEKHMESNSNSYIRG